MYKIVVFVLLTILLGDQGSIMAEEMNPDNNPALIDQVMVAIKLTETEGEKQPYQTLHTPVELYIYGTDAEVQYKIKQFNKDGFVTKTKNGRPVVVAQALGAYGLLDIDFNRFAKNAGIVDFDFRKDEWQDPALQDKIAKELANEYFKRYGSWDLVRIAWFGGPERAKKIKNGDETITSMPQNIQDDLGKFKTKLDTEVSKAPPTTIDTTMVDVDYDRGIPVPEEGFTPFPLPMSTSPNMTMDVNVPSQGPMGRPEQMLTKLLSSLVPESSRGIYNKTPGSPREIR